MTRPAVEMTPSAVNVLSAVADSLGDSGVVVATGGRSYEHAAVVFRVLDEVLRVLGRPLLLVHGACRTGADFHADSWAMFRRVTAQRWPAEAHGKWPECGPIRNTAMLAHAKPSLVVGFPGGSGTADCLAKAKLRGVPRLLVGESIAGIVAVRGLLGRLGEMSLFPQEAR